MDAGKKKKLHIPFPTGPHATGCMELMTEYSPEGCFARIFYPTNIPSNQLDKYSEKWIRWMPDDMYLEAFAAALRIPYFIFKYGPSLIGLGTYYIPTISDAPLSDGRRSYPLVIFSHGYAATRFICSNYCNTLASYGFVVAAMEHRDKSSPITFYYDSPESAETDNRTWVNHQHFHSGDDSSHRYAQRNAQVMRRRRAPHFYSFTAIAVVFIRSFWFFFSFFFHQLKIRHKECTKLLDTFLELNAGVPVKNVLKSSFDIGQFKNRIDVDNIIAIGFSFGGATSMYNAWNDNRYRALVVLDSWMFPLKSEPFINIQQPLLCINTHTFQIQPNLSLLRKHMSSKSIRHLYSLKNTTHESPTDTPYIYGYWLDLLMLKKMDAETALNLHSSLTVKFLRDIIGYPENCDDAQIFIKKHSNDFVEDFISYTKRVKRKIGIFPW